MQDPEFVVDLVEKVKNEIPPVPAPPRSVSKKKAFDPTNAAFFRSVVLHSFVIVSFLLYHALESRLGWDSDDVARLKALQEIKTAIRVDVVDLPRLKKMELQDVDLSKEVSKNPETIEEKKAPEPSKDALVDPLSKVPEPVKDSKADKKTAAQKLKEIKDRLAADQKRRDEIAKLLKKKGQTKSGREELAGNVKSEGYSTTGAVAGEADVYVGKARAHLQHHWRVPGWVSASQYKARIVVRISPSGKVVYKKLTKASGSNDFDESVSRAVENADPFPIPPDGLRLRVLTDGIEFGFPE